MFSFQTKAVKACMDRKEYTEAVALRGKYVHVVKWNETVFICYTYDTFN